MPENMVGKQFNEGNYFKQTAKGNLLEGLLFHEWVKIWNSDLPRAYTADFEVYDERAANPANAEVDILVAIK